MQTVMVDHRAVGGLQLGGARARVRERLVRLSPEAHDGLLPFCLHHAHQVGQIERRCVGLRERIVGTPRRGARRPRRVDHEAEHRLACRVVGLHLHRVERWQGRVHVRRVPRRPGRRGRRRQRRRGVQPSARRHPIRRSGSDRDQTRGRDDTQSDRDPGPATAQPHVSARRQTTKTARTHLHSIDALESQWRCRRAPASIRGRTRAVTALRHGRPTYVVQPIRARPS
jgi:hypothetical protein